MPADDLGDRSADARLVGHVQCNGGRQLNALRGELGQSGGALLERARGEHGGHSRPRQLAHDLEADAAIGTRDEGNAWVRHESISFAC